MWHKKACAGERASETQGRRISRRFSFVRTDRPDHSRCNENFTFNQNHPARLVKSYIVCMKDMVFLQKLLVKAYFVIKMTGPAIGHF